MRNVSARELSVSPEELTERFVRGDESRNTDGSGLGLAIARAFVMAHMIAKNRSHKKTND